MLFTIVIGDNCWQRDSDPQTVLNGWLKRANYPTKSRFGIFQVDIPEDQEKLFYVNEMGGIVHPKGVEMREYIFEPSDTLGKLIDQINEHIQAVDEYRDILFYDHIDTVIGE